MQCRQCGSYDVIYSVARGDTVCGNCGEVLEDRTMVTETAFVHAANGADEGRNRSPHLLIDFSDVLQAPVKTIGRVYMKLMRRLADRLAARAVGGRIDFSVGLSFVGGPNSQEVALNKGLSRMGYIADRLQLPAPIQEAGRRMYTLACSLNFNAGTQQRFTCAACLYVVCRRNRSPHLLIDFSDVLQAPVKTIGRVYMKLMRRLVGGDFTNHMQAGSSGLEVPLVDPSIFIERFARRLELGGQQRKVQNTAMRLIQYMHRDWICIGDPTALGSG
ncbi:Transcription factor IIIB 60 kDa subunit [Symbiodinium microadriaticum]|uniref:Transcription factor IIIB 60 kDa subunit n=1 Tax=Symbiodinium microadriaticum TaxID=2951 RepID=A0A1Q9CLE8_SYMMI|nr:Transcription factor IIIB 60 kDa subunit [Symbiodinium microadriaticum]